MGKTRIMGNIIIHVISQEQYTVYFGLFLYREAVALHSQTQK